MHCHRSMVSMNRQCILDVLCMTVDKSVHQKGTYVNMPVKLIGSRK